MPQSPEIVACCWSSVSKSSVFAMCAKSARSWNSTADRRMKAIHGSSCTIAIVSKSSCTSRALSVGT
jgi:hypothetical protein